MNTPDWTPITTEPLDGQLCEFQVLDHLQEPNYTPDCGKWVSAKRAFVGTGWRLHVGQVKCWRVRCEDVRVAS